MRPWLREDQKQYGHCHKGGGGNAGTLAYQHVEQLMGKPPTPSLDVYSFGVILLEVYTRTPAWNGFSYAV